MVRKRRWRDEDRPLPSLGGADIELANFIEGRADGADTCLEAACAILEQIDGFRSPERPAAIGSETISDPQDWHRRYLASTGGCTYIDLGHVEACIPEVTGARAFVAYWHAMLRIVREAQQQAARRLPAGQRLRVLVNNSDGLGHAYGAHLNFLVRRRTFNDLFFDRPERLLSLAAYQASSIVLTGLGKVGSENRRDPVDYQITQRADFFETVVGPQTTYRRPIVNCRDEPLCRPRSRWARLHVIFYDANLAEVANYLKFGVMQIILAMLDAGGLDPRHILLDPLEAVSRWSHDPDLRERHVTVTGRRLTAVEHQKLVHEQAARFVDAGRCAVPEAAAIVSLWGDTLDKLAARDWPGLAPRLDWVLKRSVLMQAPEARNESGWTSPRLKYLDHLYGSLDAEEGLFWALRRAGLVERIVEDSDIARAGLEPPSDTRAWIRAALLRLGGPAQVESVDWDAVRFRIRGPGGVPEYRTVTLDDPTADRRRDWGRALDAARSVHELLDLLDPIAPANGPDRAGGSANPAPAIRPARYRRP